MSRRLAVVCLAGALLAGVGAATAGAQQASEPALDSLALAREHSARNVTTGPAAPLPRQFALVSNRREHVAHVYNEVVRQAPVKVEPPPRPKPRVQRAQAAAAAAQPVPGGPSPTGPLGIPERAVAAYRAAADLYGTACSLGWEVVAAIGRAESNHANLGQLFPDGRTWEPILGPVLDGSPFAMIRDTDDGRLDGDETWDRAVGPMQFIPGSWTWVGVDGDGDGRADPHDLDDAAASAARYLCLSGGDLTDRRLLRSAILRYNASGEYADAVMAWADAYAGRATAVDGPEAPPPAERADEKPPSDEPVDQKPRRDKKPSDAKAKEPTPSTEPSPTTSPTPTASPSPTPTPTTSPTPTPEPTPTTEPTTPAVPSDDPSPDAGASPSVSSDADG